MFRLSTVAHTICMGIFEAYPWAYPLRSIEELLPTGMYRIPTAAWEEGRDHTIARASMRLTAMPLAKLFRLADEIVGIVVFSMSSVYRRVWISR